MTTVEKLRNSLTEEFKFDYHMNSPNDLESLWYTYTSIFCTPATSPNSWLTKAHKEWTKGNKTIVLIVPEPTKNSKVYKNLVYGFAETRFIETEIVYTNSKCVKSYIIVIFKAKPPVVKSHIINFND